MIGLIDPFGIADGLNAAIYLAEGDYKNAAISAAGMIPYVGDLAKGARLAGKIAGWTGKTASRLGAAGAVAKVSSAGASLARKSKGLGDVHPLLCRAGSAVVRSVSSAAAAAASGAATGAIEGYFETGTLDGSLQKAWESAKSAALQGAALGAVRGAVRPFLCFVAGTRVVVDIESVDIESGDVETEGTTGVGGGARLEAGGGGMAVAAPPRRYVTVPIEQLVADGGGEMGDGGGQHVLARNEHDRSAPLRRRRIIHTYQRTAYHLHVLTLRDQAGHEQTLRVTDEHPFYRTAGVAGSTLPEVVMGLSGPRPTGGRGTEGWAPARLLRPGDRVRGDAGELQVLANGEEAHPQGVTVYNLEVEADHTYFVLAEHAVDDADAAWVHNARRYVPVKDSMQPTYKKGHDGTTVGDHVLSRAIGRLLRISADVAQNIVEKAFATNARKGGLEGSWLRDYRRYRRGGLTRSQALSVLRPELKALVRDAHPVLRPNKFFDKLASGSTSD